MKLSIDAVGARGRVGLCSVTGEADVSVLKHISSVTGRHIARLGRFSSLACAAWQTGAVAPFLSPLTGGSITALICHPSLALMCESKTCCAY